MRRRRAWCARYRAVTIGLPVFFSSMESVRARRLRQNQLGSSTEARTRTSQRTPRLLARVSHLVDAGPLDWFGANAPRTHATLSAAFGDHLLHNSIWNNVRQGVYVTVGTQIGSLAAAALARTSVQFVEDFDKLKAILDDGEARYKVAVSSLALKPPWRQGGVQAVYQALPKSARFHVRLGSGARLRPACGKMLSDGQWSSWVEKMAAHLDMVFTIGHSTHTYERFIELLQRAGITAVADVRTSPHSRHFPQFNRGASRGRAARGRHRLFLPGRGAGRPS